MSNESPSLSFNRLSLKHPVIWRLLVFALCFGAAVGALVAFCALVSLLLTLFL